MTKKKWFLLILIILIIVGWYFLFYKTYSRKDIAKSADMVLCIDVKRNTNTILAYFITTPSEWDLGSLFRRRNKNEFDWKNAVKIPDYIFIFHSKDQPADAWYTVLTIKDEDEFKRGLNEYEFKAEDKDEYTSGKLGLDIIKSGDRILLGNFNVKDKHFIYAVANEIFDKQDYIEEATIKKIIAPSNHFSIFIEKNDFLQEDLILNGNFNTGEMLVDADIRPGAKFPFNESSFNLHDQSLLNVAFTQPSPQVYNLIPAETKSSVSKILNFNIDSLFNSQNNKYLLDIQGIKTRADSAITYTYDDDFNKVEKMVVNNVQEPSFNFSVYKNGVSSLIEYWKRNKNIEGDSSLFVSVPFVKTYAYDKKDAVSLTSSNYTDVGESMPFTGIGYLELNPGKIPPDLLKFLPDPLISVVQKFNSLKIISTKQNDIVKLTVSLTSKVANKPFLLSVRN